MRRIILGLVAVGAALSLAIPTPAGAQTADDFYVFNKPTPGYIGPRTCLFDLARTYEDYALVDGLRLCGISLTFDITTEKRNSPHTWAKWGPDNVIEIPNPSVLWTREATSIEIVITRNGPDVKPSRTFGVEVQPNSTTAHVVTAEYYDQNDVLRGTITRTVSGNQGARLFAGFLRDQTSYFSRVVVTSDVDFAMARFRITTSHEGEGFPPPE
jgi:hypothetical protein